MKKFTIVLLSLLISACASTAQADAIPQVALNTPTLSVTATATPDLPGQLEAARADADRAREAAQVAIAAQLDAEARALNAQATAQAAEVAKLAEDNRRAEIQLTAQAAEVTRQAAVYAENDRADRADIAKREAETKRLTAEADYIRAGVEEQESAARVVGLVLLGAGVFVWALGLVWYAYKRLQIDREALDAMAPEVDPQSAQEIKAYPGGLSSDMVIAQAGITREQLIRLAQGINAGMTFTHDQWTPSDNGFSEGKFTNLQYVLVRYGRAEWADETHKGGAVLTPAGREFFAELVKQTTSPFNQPAPKRPEDDGYLSIDRLNPLPE